VDRDQSIMAERDLCICFNVREFLLEAKKGKELNCTARGRAERVYVRLSTLSELFSAFRDIERVYFSKVN
jgi:hypothetical protein